MDARALLKDVKFPGDDDLTYNIAITTPQERKIIILSRYKEEVRASESSIRLAAAIEIQRCWRGHRTRERIRRLLERVYSSHQQSTNLEPNTNGQDLVPPDTDRQDPVPPYTEGQDPIPPYINRQDLVPQHDHLRLKTENVPAVNSFMLHNFFHSLAKSKQGKTTQIGTLSHDNHVTASHSNKQSSKASEHPSLKISVSSRNSLHETCSSVTADLAAAGTTPLPPPPFSNHFSSSATVRKKREWTPLLAAVTIQRAWRNHSDVKVFKYYKNLLNFNDKSDPRQMLKSINPAESKLLDEASGGFVRFRLGGLKFPPTVYYKIFTHRSVVDMCSFSPRDYTAMCERRKLPKDLHNKQLLAPPTNKEGWYERVENNGWRPLTSKGGVFPAIIIDDGVSKKSIQPFRPLKSQRKEDIKVMQKRRKVNWLMQMYRDGMKEEQLTVPCVTPSGVESNMTPPPAMNEYSPLDVEDKEIEELLLWTQELNYENYLAYWGQLATSCISNYYDETMKTES